MRDLVFAITLVAYAGTSAAQSLKDSFNSASVDQSKWSTQQVLPGQIDFVKPGRCGASAIEIVTREGDSGIMCDHDCQRAELRAAGETWPAFGEEVWYAFSFRVDGDVPSSGSARSIIGQWKGPGDHSPMIAQRFDNGVFHITVQDNDTRRVVAKAEGYPDRLVSAQNLLAKLDPHDERAVNAVKSLQSIDLMAKTQPRLSRQLFKEKISSLFQHNQHSDETETLSQTIGVERAMISQFRALSFVAEPEKYLGSADIEIVPEANRQLPDPRKGWVDMVYRIRPGRTDNEYGPHTKGELDIWANGQKIVSVRGNLGATLKKGTPLSLVGPYFKFGTYRARVPGTFKFQFDEFSQARSKAGLASLCPSH